MKKEEESLTIVVPSKCEGCGNLNNSTKQIVTLENLCLEDHKPPTDPDKKCPYYI